MGRLRTNLTEGFYAKYLHYLDRDLEEVTARCAPEGCPRRLEVCVHIFFALLLAY